MQTTIQGTIRQQTSHPCPKNYGRLVLFIYAKGLFTERFLHKMPVSEDGTFKTTIDQKEKKENLVLKLYWQEQEQEATELAQSGPHCATAELQVAFDLDLKQHLFWFEYLNKKLLPLVEGREVEDLEEAHIAPLACLACEEEEDVRKWINSYLRAEEAREEARAYKLIAKSRLEEGGDSYFLNCFEIMGWFEQQHLAHVFYAFAQNGNTQPLHQILTLSKQQIAQHLQKAVTQKCINFNQDELWSYSESLAFLRDYLLLQTRYDDRYYDAKIIATGRYERMMEHELLNHVLEVGDLRTLLFEIANGLHFRKEQGKQEKDQTTSEKKLKKGDNLKGIPFEREILEFILDWDVRFQHFPPFLDKMVGEFYEDSWFISHYYRYDQNDWLTKIEHLELEQPYPDAFKEKENPLTAYATAIAQQNEIDYPTYQLHVKMEKNNFKHKERLYETLHRIHDFDIQKTAVSRYFKVVPNPGELGFVTQIEYDLLQSFQRSIKLADGIHDFETVATLMDTVSIKKDENTGEEKEVMVGKSSAVAIVHLGKHQFQKDMAEEGMLLPVSHAIYCRAKATYDVAKETASNYMLYESPNVLMPSVLKPTEQQAAKRGGNLPNMETLFGSLDTCHCEHCQSVYSPAAYLTDMLHWLNSDVVCQVSNKTAFKVLDTCRPDIKYLHLNCKNAHTLMPYIDLVNEVLLANLVAAPTEALLKSLQTNGASEQLMLESEHIGRADFDAAKDKLKAAKYPLSLPYDMGWSESRAYLEELGLSQAELLQAFNDEKAGVYYENIAWAKAYLGLNEKEYELLLESSPQLVGSTAVEKEKYFWETYFGLDHSTKNLGDFLEALEMDKATFQAIYETFYVSGRKDLLPATDDFEGCSWDEFEIVSALDFNLLHRLLRFVRLQKRSGLSILQLDQIIDNEVSNLSSTQTINNLPNDQVLIHLTGIKLLAAQFNLSVDNVLVWCSKQPFQGNSNPPSNFSAYYENFYKQEHFSQERLDFFDRDVIDNPALNTIIIDSFTTQQLTWLNEVYGFETGDIEQLNQLKYNNTAQSFQTIHLEYYHIHATLAKILGLSITELLAYFKKVTSPFTNSISTPTKILQFIEQVQAFQKVNLPIQTFIDLDAGEGRYKLNAQGESIHTSKFDRVAEAVWQQIKTAITPILETEGVVKLKKEFFTAFAHALDLDYLTFFVLESRVNINNWTIKCLNDMKASKDWKESRKNFTRVFRYFYRLTTYQKALDLTAIDVRQLHTFKNKYIASTHHPMILDWLEHDFTKDNFPNLIGCKKAKDLSSKLGTSVFIFLLKVKNLHNLTGGLTLSNLDATLTDMYDDFSSLKAQLSLVEFQEIYIRAQALASNPQDLVEVLDLFFKIWETATRSQITVPTLWDWVWNSYNLSSKQLVNIEAHHQQLKNTLRSRYDSFEAWASAITLLHNQFRTQVRDALVAYYVAHKGFENSADIYAKYLLDPEMEACMKTSRTKLAISGVQLLMHRAMMGLEPTICPDEDDKTEWKWRKNYRVWEANRKVFLYPENWIVPSLRLDKTPFFASLEDALLQDDINEENAEKAFSTYLTQLHEVSRLDILAFCVEPNQAEERADEAAVIHVFARTFITPYVYFYRTRDKYKKWTAWQQLDLDIEGDHLIPVFVNRRLYLYWPLFIEKEHRKIKRVIEGEEQNAPYFEIKLCCSSLEFGKWTPKKVLEGSMKAGHYAGLGCYNNLRYKLGQDCPLRISFSHKFRNPFHGPIREFVPNETDNGNLVLSNSLYQDYAKVSLEKKAFYFWPEVQQDGSLVIHTRRDFHEDWEDKHDGYTELAYEDSFKIDACTGRLDIIPPMIPAKEINNKRFLARPFYTLPHAQQMEEGLDRPSDLHKGVYVKTQKTHGNGSLRILRRTNDKYHLTYPVQEKHSMWHLPFFMGDRKRTHFFERAWETQCRKIWIIDPNGENQSYYIPQFYEAQARQYDVQLHQHPFACLMLEEFNRYGIDGLLASKHIDLKRQKVKHFYFPVEYQPVSTYINYPFPIDQFDFDCLAPYAQYNWEIFYHAPSLIARQLKSNGQYAEALRWLQFVFDPTNRDLSDLHRIWRIKPFIANIGEDSIQNLLKLLGATGLSSAEEKKRKAFQTQIEIWRDQPFQPHLIAELRIRPYMLWTVCEYIDVLVEWADSLFRQDTMESINEATNLYILAAELLGPRPKTIHKTSQEKTTYFHQIKNGLDEFSNALINVENEIINLDTKVCCEEDPYAADKGFQLPDLMFCVPHNPKLLEIWNRVEDRLFKIRHCMNIEGQVRELALFEPPIDPALLVQATALGLSIGDILTGLNAPEPHYRFSYLLQKANEFTNEVKALGGQLLSALEKKDAESLSLIRQRHEQNMLNASKAIKKMQVEEAKQNLASMRHSQKLIEIRLAEYEGKEYMNSREADALKLTKKAETFMYIEQAQKLVSSVFAPIPDAYVGFPSNFAKLPGGDKLAKVSNLIAESFGVIGSIYRNEASRASTFGSYDRRQEDWDFQIKTAKEELKQMEKQLLAAEIRLAIAEKDLANHELQIEHSQEIYDFLKYKFTNVQLYTWMAGEVSQLYYRAYQLAYDMAKQAERAMMKEIDLTASVIQAENWDSSYKGLMSGEKLSLQLKELDDAYIKQNKRKFELSTNISLKLLDARALVNLIQHKYCQFELKEYLFQMDFKGKSLSNIKIRSISLSIPSVIGPYTSIHVKLRKKDGEEMITSTGVNDSGIFEPNFNAPRYLPFEYLLVDDDDATWELILNKNSHFDLTTISDVVLHIRYEAEDNGTETIEDDEINELPSEKSHFMSWRHDFPLDWQGLLQDLRNGISLIEPIEPPLGIEHIPYHKRTNLDLGNTKLDSSYYLYKDATEMKISKIDDWSLLTVTEEGNLMIEDIQIEDIWLLYQLKYS